MKRVVVFFITAMVTGVVIGGEGGPAPASSLKGVGRRVSTEKVQFARDIQPILASNCFVCHGPDEKNRKAGLRLDVRDVAIKALRSGAQAIVPGDAKASELVTRIFSSHDDRMPPIKSKLTLKQPQKDLIKRWIEEGAEYQGHWAFIAPQRPAMPITKAKGWAKNALDHFVLARIEAEGLQPSAEADRYALARRASLDLTGLPPTIDMVDRFVKDQSPDAYEKYVERLFELPSYGEHWAHNWLDLARYADSNGYATDNLRTIWKYRDWVIDAINVNKPFDQFTIEQIAGDLLPKASTDEILATAFHRNTLTNDEGGTSDEEFRAAAVVDRVNTTMQVWMGVTMMCAQCHTHKYDPISQEEYFRMYAIFNQTEDADRSDNSPLLAMPTPEQQKQKAKLEGEITALDKQLKQPGQDAKKLDTQSPERKRRDQLTALRKQLSALQPLTTPIMRELSEGKKRVTRIHIRGNFLDEGKQVSPGVPAAFHPLSPGEPANRLAVARWLVDAKNPLTARVTVNRYWEQVFGAGLVETPEDFGNRGKLPTHPELLDWLASELVAQKWDVKKFLRMLVTSATYRQSSRVTPELIQRDPGNRFFARGPRHRGSAEIIRDQALFVGGLLSPKMHGPPVRPPCPKLGLTAAFGSRTDWEDSTGEDKHRRALYTQWRRTTPYPSMITFDAPSRNVCSVKRARTNTPLQALVTLNDPVYVEAAQGLARRMVKEGGTTPAARATYGFRLCLARPPRDTELNRLVGLYRQAREKFASNRNEAVAMATDPLGPLPQGMDPVDLAAWTVVGNVLLNLDEMFAKR